MRYRLAIYAAEFIWDGAEWLFARISDFLLGRQ
jgi:hypothetical protein